tara:strand:+ start:1875 stop:2288 length:414 start_codon:yes stop_codon:yes gene_type:complete
MAFKLGREKRGFKTPDNTTLFRKTMTDGSLAQANNDGTIDIDPSVDINSPEGAAVVAHEQKHQLDMKMGRADYGDNWVMWEDKIYIRKDVDGVSIIDGPNGRWPEGDPNHPWEAEAIAVEQATVAALKQEEKINKQS